MNLAHRGASARAPENTLEAFQAGLEDGAGGLELDLRLTSDGCVVVMHDATVDRTTDGSGPVRGMTLERLRRLDAGYRFTTDGGCTYPFRGKGITVPTFEEVLNAFPDVPVNADIKDPIPGVERTVLSVIEAASAGGRVIVASRHLRVMRRFRRLVGGRIPTAASGPEIRAFYLLAGAGLQRVLRPGYGALQVPSVYRGVRVVTPRFVRAAHGMGLRVDVWTINGAEEMRSLLDMGVDVIMTDHPGVLAGVLRQRSHERTGED
ncbi:glycerophosphodiester phosphodiesterase [Rubrobacter calidifluminis]|uniref:glycerophosphodiester phosphodiesterase n=1 Tax=Rubrobacter calidifluminis TaxID=1392640 RepID=UPI00236113AA|nr:glycerophosphodiester phosphodiesterase [Rubrobacter calidifluminis]